MYSMRAHTLVRVDPDSKPMLEAKRSTVYCRVDECGFERSRNASEFYASNETFPLAMS